MPVHDCCSEAGSLVGMEVIMKIERVDDKTVKCFLSNEEMEAYDIDYKDFIMRSEKAKEIVQEIIEQAAEEVGYKPPKFAFDLQIMMLPDQGVILTFSEKDPLESKEGEQILECLKEMKKVFESNKAQLKKDDSKDNKDSKDKVVNPEKRPEIAIFVFPSLGRIMEYASALPQNLRVQSALYVVQDMYYLYLHKGSASYERYSRACIQALEFGSLYAAEQDKVLYLQEHGECLIAEKALKKLRL